MIYEKIYLLLKKVLDFEVIWLRVKSLRNYIFIMYCYTNEGIGVVSSLSWFIYYRWGSNQKNAI